MALNIKNDETHRLAHELAHATGESITTAVTIAVRERLAAVQRLATPDEVLNSVRDIQDFVRTLPVLDSRTPEEILGYDDSGLPG